MTEVAFSSLCRRFAGQTGWVVGRGPTLFRYQDLAGAAGPVFFINDAVSQEQWLPPGHPSFFFAHDRSMADWLRGPPLRSLPVLITDQPTVGPKAGARPGLLSGPDDPLLAGVAQAVLYRGAGPLDPGSLLDRSREEIRDSGQLFLANGTIQPLLHFAWYLGCTHLNLVGCDGFPGVGYDGRLENRSHSVQQNAILIRRRQEIVLRRLALPRTLLGTPAFRIQMIVEARAVPANHDRLRRWSQDLVGEFRAAGCAELRTSDHLAKGRGLWINGTWPGLEPCIECLASSDHLARIAAADAFLEGGADSGLRSSYQALP